MDMRGHSHSRFDRWGHLAVMALLGFAFVTGGDSNERNAGQVLSQLLALPMIVWAALRLRDATHAPLRLAALGVAGLLVATLALQLLPVPANLWHSIAVRGAIGVDLETAGVDAVRTAWSLSPMNSERALWSILPAMAVFLGALAIPARWHRGMLVTVVLLTAASLVLGVVQLGLPQDSLLNLFPQWVPALNGFFANPNHQGIALAVSAVMVAALVMSDWTRNHATQAARRRRLALMALAAMMLGAIPVTGSRSAFLLVVVGLLAVAVALRGELRRLSSGFPSKRPVLGVWLGLLALAGLLTSLLWLRFDPGDSIRWTLATTTAAMAREHAPFGAGIGSFAPWFDQAAPAALVQWEYFQHSHNEYVHWAFEAGVAGVLCVLAVIALMVTCYPAARHAAGSDRDRGVAIAAWLGCVLLLSHAWVEYGLRTQSLMTVAALLAGLAVAQRADAAGHAHGKKRADER